MSIKHVLFFSAFIAVSMPPTVSAAESPFPSVTYTAKPVYPNGKPAADAALIVSTVDDTTRSTSTFTCKPDTAGKVTFDVRPNPLDIIRPNVNVYAASSSGVGFFSSLSSTVTLQPFTSVRVHFIDNHGKPVAHILVAPMEFIGDASVKWNVAVPCQWQRTTDDTGCITLNNLPQGYKLVMGADDDRYFCTDQRHGFDLAKSPTTPDATVQVLPAQSISGQVVCKSTGKPLAGIHVMARTRTSNIGEGISDAGGNFTIGGLPQATYTVCQPDDPTSTVDWISNPQTAIVVNGTDCTGVKLSLFHGGLVTGKITDPISGKPVPGSSIWANPDINEEGLLVVGTTSMIIGPDGVYRLRFAPCTAIIHADAVFNTDETMPKKEVVLREGDAKVINFHVKAPSPAHGIVIGLNGKPAAGALVLEKESSGFKTIETDSKGKFAFNKPVLDEVINLEAERGNLGSPRPIHYEHQNPVVLRLSPGSLGSLAGKVVDPEGRPVAGASVTLCYWVPDTQGRPSYSYEIAYATLDEDGYSTLDEATTNAHGGYQFKSIFGNTAYRVLITASGFVGCYSKAITVKSGKTAQVPPIKLREATLLGGKVVNADGEPVANVDVLGGYTDFSSSTLIFTAATDLTGHFLIQGIAKKQMQFTVQTWQDFFGPYTLMPGRKDYILTLKPKAH